MTDCFMAKRSCIESESDPDTPLPKTQRRYCSFKSAWKNQDFRVSVKGIDKVFSGSVLSGVDGDERARCMACQVSFSVCHGGAHDVRKHFSSSNHIAAVLSSRKTVKLGVYGFGESRDAKRAREKMEKQQLQVQQAETLFVQFVVEHNLPFRIGDHFTKLVKSMFPDSEVARQFQCSRTKTSVLARYGSGKYYHDKLIETLRSDPPIYFSLLIDESNDRGVEAKDLVVLVRFFDPTVMKAVTRFIDLPTANNGTAAAIFAKVDECLSACQLPYERLICFNSDTCNTMKGQRNGVVHHLVGQQPALIDFGCICHLENLAVKAAVKTLPIKIESLMVDINTHFYLSIKRKEEFKSFCEFVNVTYKQILAHVETRWLSLLRVVSRVLELWPALVSYFNSHLDAERHGRVKAIKDQLCNETKLYLLFLNFLLPTINAFSVAFQATSSTTIHLLHPEMRKLTKRMLRYFLIIDCIDTIDVTQTEFEDINNQLDDKDLEIGEGARSLLTIMTKDGMMPEVDRFLAHVRLFYSTFVKKLIQKFPFKSTLLSDLRILNPAERTTYRDFPNAVIRLANQLPQLQLQDRLDDLRTEVVDFQMADETDLPIVDDGVDAFWAKMHDIRQIGSATPAYSTLLVLVRALLSLPASNADSERCFSMVRKIDSEERSHIERSTVASLLSLKINVDEDCFAHKPSAELLKINKSAVRKYNEEHGSYSQTE